MTINIKSIGIYLAILMVILIILWSNARFFVDSSKSQIHMMLFNQPGLIFSADYQSVDKAGNIVVPKVSKINIMR